MIKQQQQQQQHNNNDNDNNNDNNNKETKDTFVALQQQQHHHPIINNLVRIATSSIAVLECSLCEIDTHFPVLCSLYTSTFFIFIALCCALTRRSGGALNYIITGGLVLEEATRNLIDYKFYSTLNQ